MGRRLSDVYPYLAGVCDLKIEYFDAQEIIEKADLVFFATPSGVASSLAEEFVQADFLLLICLVIIACQQMFIKNGIKITCQENNFE